MIMKKRFKKILASVLAAGMALSLAGCGSQEGNDSAQTAGETKEFVWVPEYVELDTDSGLYNSRIQGDYIYYEKYNWDEEMETSSCSIASVSILDGTPGRRLRLLQCRVIPIEAFLPLCWM